MALYNKYRPSNLSMICGQEHIKRILANQVKSKDLAHAYLFVGPAGTGKTTAARIVAAMVNAEGGMTVDISMKDKFSAAIINGEPTLDVYEMDAATTNGIDDIRKIREWAELSPSEMSKRVFIVDECHALSSQAWQALLKLLEEPPRSSMFILCTTDVMSVPETVKTRCMCFDFRPLQLDDVIQYTKKVAGAENIQIDDEACRMVAMSAQGSLRDVLSKLEKLRHSGDRITATTVSAHIGVATRASIRDYVEAVTKPDFAKALLASSESLSKGVKAFDFLSQVADYVHDLVFCKSRGYDLTRFGYSPKEIEEICAIQTKMQEDLGGEWRRNLFYMKDILDKNAKVSVFNEQPQRLVNFNFAEVSVHYHKVRATEQNKKGGTA